MSGTQRSGLRGRHELGNVSIPFVIKAICINGISRDRIKNQKKKSQGSNFEEL